MFLCIYYLTCFSPVFAIDVMWFPPPFKLLSYVNLKGVDIYTLPGKYTQVDAEKEEGKERRKGRVVCMHWFKF